MNELERKLVNGKVVVTYEEELPRYRVRKTQADYWFNGSEIYDYLVESLGLHFCLPEWKQSIHEIDVSKDSDNPFEDFKKQVIEKYGDKFNYYWVRELKHSGSSFSIAETPHKDNGEFTVQNWDTSNVGFVAVPKDSKLELSTLGTMLTDLWEGTIDVVEVVDNLTDDVLEQYEFWLHRGSIEEEQKIRKHIKDNFNCEVE